LCAKTRPAKVLKTLIIYYAATVAEEWVILVFVDLQAGEKRDKYQSQKFPSQESTPVSGSSATRCGRFLDLSCVNL
jgi:hypothetical protein